MSNLFIPNGFKREGCCHLRVRNCRCWWQPLCFVPWRVSAKKRRMDTVSGTVSAVVSRTVLFQLVYYLDYFYQFIGVFFWNDSVLSDGNNILSDNVYFILSFSPIQKKYKMLHFRTKLSHKTLCFPLFCKFRKLRCFKYFPKNLKSFCRAEDSDIGCLNLIKRQINTYKKWKIS